MYNTICLTLAMLMCSPLAAQGADPVLPQNSLRVEIAGKTILGVGFTFEHAWRNENKKRHPRAFNSVDATVGYAGYIFIITGVGINRNWYLGMRKKWIVSCGTTFAALICPDPTPKQMREYYDNAQIYSREYINPVEPWLLGNISCRYTFRRAFIQGSFTPVLFYDRAYNTGFNYGPLGGVSVGFNLKTRT
jgi:hypothetical protein